MYNRRSADIRPAKEKKSNKYPKSPPMMEELHFKHPFALLLVGRTGSGKSTVLQNLLLNKAMFATYFDEMYLFSKTSEMDPTLEPIKWKTVYKEEEKYSDEIKNLLRKCKTDVKKNKKAKAKKRLVVFEDASSLKLNKELIDIFTTARHYGLSVVMCQHKYSAPERLRLVRLNASHIIIFKCNQSERTVLYKEYGDNDRKTFHSIMKEAFTPSEEHGERPFFFINQKSPFRLRKNLDNCFECF